MSKKVLYLYRFSPEQAREAALQLGRSGDPDDPSGDFHQRMNVDFALGIVAQDFCHTRDALMGFVREAQLLPYLESFLARRGWLDDDWRRRIATAVSPVQ